jgi:hypothetical protein
MDQVPKSKETMKPYHKVKELLFIENKLSLIVDGESIVVDLRIISLKLLKATHIERNTYIISPSGYGIHWPSLDEDISINGLLKFSKNQKSKKKVRSVT